MSAISCSTSQLLRRQSLALFFGQPLEVFNQLGGLDDECHGEVLRGMELVPVALGGEVAQAGFYVFQRFHSRAW